MRARDQVSDRGAGERRHLLNLKGFVQVFFGFGFVFLFFGGVKKQTNNLCIIRVMVTDI